MGGGGSKAEVAREERVALIMMPVYYTPGGTNADAEIAQRTWNDIKAETSGPYLEAKKDPDFQLSGPEWFKSIFYERLFDVHSDSRALFSQTVQRGNLIERMVDTIVNVLSDANAKQNLNKMVVFHCEKGIKAVEYGTFGEVLLFTVRKALGDAFTPEVEMAWKKMYSEVFRIIIPMVVEFERKTPKKYDAPIERSAVADA